MLVQNKHTDQQTRSANKIPDTTALFTLQGAYSPKKLKGVYKLIMKLVTKTLIKRSTALNPPPNPTNKCASHCKTAEAMSAKKT